MNEVKLLNIGGVDQNIKDQYARDVIAPSENGLDSSTNLPVSSRHYDVGEYLIGQTRAYYEVIAEINVGDTIVVGTNVRATTVSDELIALKNQSADTVLEVVADVETSATASKGYSVGSYLYWNYGLSAGMYKVISEIDTSDALVVDTNIEAADKIMNIILGIESGYSNPNLLDNSWFMINQRGAASYTGVVGSDIYTLDRWVLWQDAGETIITKTSGGITITTDENVGLSPFRNRLPEEYFASLSGKTITISAIVDGVLKSATGVVPIVKDATNWQSITFITFENGVGINFVITPTSISSFCAEFQITVPKNKSITIRAVKLEVGSVSTLANDTAPNYAEELAKCQRYYFRNTRLNTTPFIGMATDSNWLAGFLFPVTMRISPSVSIKSIKDFFFSEQEITSGTAPTSTPDGISNIFKQSAFTTGKAYYVWFEASADL